MKKYVFTNSDYRVIITSLNVSELLVIELLVKG